MPPKNDGPCVQYERLRSYALGNPDAKAPIRGLGVLLLKGMPAWLDASSRYSNDDAPFELPDREGRPLIQMPSLERTQLGEILAEIVLKHCQPEVS